jgi:hypothetical protein
MRRVKRLPCSLKNQARHHCVKWGLHLQAVSQAAHVYDQVYGALCEF